MRKYFSSFLVFVLIVFIISCWGTSSSSHKSSTIKATLKLNIKGDNSQAGKASSDIDLTVTSYIIAGTGPNGAVFNESTLENNTEVEVTAFGDWTIQVDAKNAGGIILQKGSQVATVGPSAVMDIDILLRAVDYGPSSDIIVDFETGDFSQTSSHSAGLNESMEVSAEHAAHGFYGLKYTSGGSGSEQSYVIKTFTPRQLIYARIYFRLGSGFTLKDGNVAPNGIDLFSFMDSSGNRLCGLMMERAIQVDPPFLNLYGLYADDSKYNIEFMNWNGGIWAFIEPDKDYYIDMYYSFGNGNGTAGIYINGELWASHEGLTNSTCIPDRIMLGSVPYYGDYATKGSIIYFDDAEIDTNLIGAY